MQIVFGETEVKRVVQYVLMAHRQFQIGGFGDNFTFLNPRVYSSLESENKNIYIIYTPY